MSTPESIRELLNSSDFGQRLSAVNQIRQLDPASAFELIQVAIQDKNPRVRYAAVSQLATLGHQDLATSFTILRDRLLNDSETDVQAAAADALGALKQTDALEDLQSLYHRSSEWIIQFSIVAALGEMGDLRALDLLETAFNSEVRLIKLAAIGSLGELGDRRALPLLLPSATDPDWEIRYRVMQALGHFNDPDVRPTLEQLANDSVEAIAREATALLQAGTVNP